MRHFAPEDIDFSEQVVATSGRAVKALSLLELLIELAMTCGAQEYIMKPFDEDILVGKLEQVGLL